MSDSEGKMTSQTTEVYDMDGDAPSGRQSSEKPPVKKPSVSGPSAKSVVRKKTDPGEGLSPASLYLNRELTWLDFNKRVLHEARDERTPLLERVKFIAIVSSNLDEFFMKRIGGLKQQHGAGIRSLTVDGRTPRQQIDECYEKVRELEKAKQELLPIILELLREKGVALHGYPELSAAEKKQMRQYYLRNIFPLVTPQSIDPAHPFPFISNLSLNLLVTLRYPRENDVSLARVKVPVGAGIPRLIRIGNADRFVLLEDVMCHNLDLLFPGMQVVCCEFFRVTRNANTEKNEEQADDLLAMIESELQDRKFAPIVRIETGKGMDTVRRGMVAAELALDETADVFEVEGIMAMRDLMEIAVLEYPELRDPPFHPIDHPLLPGERSIFHLIRDTGSVLLHHPYESFSTSVERFLLEASEDPKVRAIKMTLYRTSRQSRIIDALIHAAQNGKQVAVVVELKARFDEAANIALATRMEEAGIHVTYGVVGLKTHCKVILVVRQDYDGIRRYVHIGTGNYHAVTARIYTDLGLLTCNEAIGQDATELFNYLTTGYTPRRKYEKMLPAPKFLKKALLAGIDREIRLHSDKRPGLIQFKMNALEDADIVEALYRASRAGVRVDLIVRDTCRLRPGLPGISKNIRVVSIVGRFLEHSRIYYFRNGGKEQYFIGSADAMKRNLEARVEVVVPVEDRKSRNEIRTLFDVHLNDNRSAWDMQQDGTYVQRMPGPVEESSGSHEVMIELAAKRQKKMARLKRRKAQGVGGRNLR
ncbi:MAG TPA: polyphosphate kinase 1 [Geobacteraceae bacterium]|nr:polyphosphate kinase 1 [Geobacteraceae bacterium]